MTSSTAGHTPGPWHVSDSWEVWPHQRGKHDRAILVLADDLGEASICMVAEVAPENIEIMERELANARLIAAAPELLAALESIASLEGSYYDRAIEARVLARAAITAAKGGA